MGKALEGIRVLDFTTMAAGPTAAAMLADYGAEVIKIERPGRGEDGRKFPPMVDGESLTYCWFNRGKKSLAVDMKDPEGLELVKKLIPTAQVILENFRPGTMKKFGLDYESVCKVKPDMVYVSLTTYGQTGRLISKPGYDIIAQAMSGIMSVTGEADGAPQKSGIPLGDAVIFALGLSPGLGFIHVGHDCSFVYDIADLYKSEVVIPVAFQVASEEPEDLPGIVRRKVRDVMTEKHILERMVKDIRWLFLAEDEKKEDAVEAVYLWDDKEGTVRNGRSYGQEEWE